MGLMPKRTDREKGERRPALALRDEMNRLFEDFLTGWMQPGMRGEWLPSLDVSETDTQVVVKAEVPGIDPSDIDISIMGDTLTIRGEKKEETRKEEENYHRVERRYGRFERVLTLPTPVDPDKVNAACKDGILTVTMDKREESKARAIKIKSE